MICGFGLVPGLTVFRPAATVEKGEGERRYTVVGGQDMTGPEETKRELNKIMETVAVGHKTKTHTQTHTHSKLPNRFQHVSFVGAFFVLLYLKIFTTESSFYFINFFFCVCCQRVFPPVAAVNGNGSTDAFKITFFTKNVYNRPTSA